MTTCPKYEALADHWKSYIQALIAGNLVGKKADTFSAVIEDSDLKTYAFKVTVTKTVKDESKQVIGYLRSDAFKGGKWELTKRPRLMKNEKAPKGVFGIYG